MSKFIICEKCCSELSGTESFCPHCGAPVIANSGFDIYNKGNNFYLRYRKGSSRVQVPLSANYMTLSADKKRSIYLNAKKSLNIKLSARAALEKSPIGKLDTFGDLVDNYVYHICVSRLSGTGHHKIKISTYENNYMNSQTVLKQFSICTIRLKNISYDLLQDEIDIFIRKRISGEITGKPVTANTIGRELSFIIRVINYSYEEELLDLPHSKIQKLFKYIKETSPTEDDVLKSSRNLVALTSEEFESFLREFTRPFPTDSFEDVFKNIISDCANNQPLYRLLLFCFKKFTANNHSLEVILSKFRSEELRLLSGDTTNPTVASCYWSFYTFLKREYRFNRVDEPFDIFFTTTLEASLLECLHKFPVYYSAFTHKLEYDRFGDYYYPIVKSYYHGSTRVTKAKFDNKRSDSIMLLKEMKELPSTTNSLAIPLLLLLSQTGLRLNEASSLTVGDIGDCRLPNGKMIKTISITHQSLNAIQFDTNNLPMRDNNGHFVRKIVESSPKSKSSNRTLPLTPLAEQAIAKAMKLRGLTYADQNKTLFSTTRLSADTQEYNKWMTLMLSNLRCTELSGTHTLRRTVASQLAQHGYSRTFIGQILGHSETSVTEHYITIDMEHKYLALCESLMPQPN